ncbi:MAG TPA: AbrB/MazE/SpoVT family DNA-binding domain-containing protein [Candidatus Paceibacterota bacterium]
MAQKVIQIGSSIGVTIPKDMAEDLGFSVGEAVEVRADGPGRAVIERQNAGPKKSVAEAVKWAVAYIEKYRSDFEALADK